MTESNPSLYETLLQNFDADLPLYQVNEDDHCMLSVLDNLQRILNSRAGTLAHLPDYGLPDMGRVLQGMSGTAHELMNTLRNTLLRYEPRLAGVEVELLPQQLPGHLQYRLDLQLHDGRQLTFATALTAEGKLLVSHLKRQQWVSR